VLHIHRALHRALERALRWRLIPFNPAKETDPPRREKREIRTLSREEVERFFRAARETRLFALYAVAALTGLREGELLGLRWQDVEKDAKGRPVLRVRQKLVRSSKGVSFERGTKTGKGRAVRLPALGVAALKEHRKRQLEDRLKAGTRWKETGLVFTSTRSTYIDPSNLSNKYLRKVLEKAELPRVRFHDLRHGFATVLFKEADAPAKMVAEMLGHADISMTLNTYTHYLPTMQEEIINRLDELFPPDLLEDETSTE
jgi:integrase